MRLLMLPIYPSVANGYRGRRGNAIREGHSNQGGFWDPLIRGYGPVNVFDEDKSNNSTKKTNMPRHGNINIINNSHDRDSDDNNNNNNSDENGEDTRYEEQRHEKRRSNRALWRQQ